MDIVFALLVIWITALIFRAEFSVKERIKSDKIKIGLMVLMAKKNGATNEEIDEVFENV